MGGCDLGVLTRRNCRKVLVVAGGWDDSLVNVDVGSVKAVDVTPSTVEYMVVPGLEGLVPGEVNTLVIGTD